MSDEVALPRATEWRSTARLRRSALGLGALLLTATSDAEPELDAAPCRASGVAVQVFTGSRLFEAPGERLELLAGRQLGCDDAETRQLLAALAAALDSPLVTAANAAPVRLPPDRFSTPLRIHVSPRLPPRQAPLAGVEVHVSRRELLLARSALAELGPDVWRHELLHLIAAPPPEAPGVARRLWLTVEEGVVAHVAQASTVARGEALPAHPLPEPAARANAVESRRALPALALLASPAYDPHPLAAGLTRELARGEAAVPVELWLDCLSARPSPLPAGAEASAVFEAFIARCSPEAAGELSSAIGRWWVDAQPPVVPLASARRKAAALPRESH